MVILQPAAGTINGVFGTTVTAGDLGVVLLPAWSGSSVRSPALPYAVGAALRLLRAAALIPAAAASTRSALACGGRRRIWACFGRAACSARRSMGCSHRDCDQAVHPCRRRRRDRGFVVMGSNHPGRVHQLPVGADQGARAATWEAVRQALPLDWRSLRAVLVRSAQTRSVRCGSTQDIDWAGLEAIRDGASDLWASVRVAGSAGVERLIGFLTRLRDFAIGVWNAIAGAAQRRLRRGAAGGRRRQGFARGGPVFGAGSATSDSIPAWLSNGEFVVRAAAVRKYGLSLFNTLNRLQLDPNAFQRFADGGLVRSLQVLMPPPIRFAEGGLVPQPASTASLRPINLTIGADTLRRPARARGRCAEADAGRGGKADPQRRPPARLLRQRTVT